MQYRQKGFTIVELIVVVIVIAILAMISVFAFGSWRTRTATTEMKNELYAASTSLKNHRNFKNVYPANLAAIPYTPNSGVTLTYTLRSDGQSYCLDAGSTAVATAPHWYIDSSVGSTPVQTACS